MSKSYEELWHQGEDFDLPGAIQARERCVFAEPYYVWGRDLCARTAKAGDLVAINQAKILILDKYHEWRAVAPKSHRNRLSPSGHICLFEVFEEAYIALRAMELALTPPMLFIPEPPPPPLPPPPPPQIAGIFLGEETL